MSQWEDHSQANFLQHSKKLGMFRRQYPSLVIYSDLAINASVCEINDIPFKFTLFFSETPRC